jgi:prepilin-type processing-associated H-X9-DG protein
MSFAEYPRSKPPGMAKSGCSHSPSLTLGVGGLIVLILVSILYPVFRAARPFPPRTRCLSNVKSMVMDLIVYSGDYDETLPKAPRWMDTISSYSNTGVGQSIFHDVEGVGADDYGYAFRSKASLLDESKVDKTSEFILVFDSNLLGRNAYGEPSSMPNPGRHDGGNSVGFLDGHAKRIAMSGEKATYR